jgi:hypothetical protein
MKDQIVAVDQAANIGIQFQGKRPSGPAFIFWSIPTKRTPADAAGKAGDADGGRHARQHVKKLGKTSSIPFDPHGMSGSLVWNTRIKEFAASGETWTPGVARLTELLWDWDTSDRFLFATRIDHVAPSHIALDPFDIGRSLFHRRDWTGTGGAATDMFYLTPPRHISTLPKTEVSGLARHVRFTLRSGYRQPAPTCPFGAKNRQHAVGIPSKRLWTVV